MTPSAKATALTHRLGGYQAPTLSDQYLGWGLVGVLVAGLVLWWRDLRLWLFAAVGVFAAFAVGRTACPTAGRCGGCSCTPR